MQTIVSTIKRDNNKILIYKIKIEAETSVAQQLTKHYIIDGGFVVIYPMTKNIDPILCIGCGYQVSDTSIGGITISAEISGTIKSNYSIKAEFDKVIEWVKLSWKQII